MPTCESVKKNKVSAYKKNCNFNIKMQRFKFRIILCYKSVLISLNF